MWKQVRGPAGAGMCETRDLGIKWPYWHTLVFRNETTIDMRYVCPKDVRKMLVQRARSEEELKEGTWLEPGLALLRKKVKENWAEKHRDAARKIFLEGGWTQKRLFDSGWSDVSQCQACQLEESKERHRLHHCPEWYKVRREIPQAFRKLENEIRREIPEAIRK